MQERAAQAGRSGERGSLAARDEKEKKGGRRLTGQRCVIAIYVSLQSSVYRHDKESRAPRAYRLKPFKERRAAARAPPRAEGRRAAEEERRRRTGGAEVENNYLKLFFIQY